MKYLITDVGNWSIHWTLRISPHLEDGVPVSLPPKLQTLLTLEQALWPSVRECWDDDHWDHLQNSTPAKLNQDPTLLRSASADPSSSGKRVPVAESRSVCSGTHTHRCVFDSSVVRRTASTGVCVMNLIIFCPPVATIDVMWLLSPWMHTDGSTNCTLLGPVDCDSFYKWIPLSRWPGCHLIRGIAFYLLCISFLYYIFITLCVVCPPRPKWRWGLLSGQVWCSDVSQEHQRSHSPSETVTQAPVHTHARARARRICIPVIFYVHLFCVNTLFRLQKWISNPNFSLTN